jgi:hypothetical protein
MKINTRLLTAVAYLGVVTTATAQDEGAPPRPAVEDLLPSAAQSPQEEMVELFQAVERRLQGMGGYLLDAGAGDTRKLAEVGDAGMLELLQQGRPNSPQPTGGVADLLSISKAEGAQVLEDIDRILVLAQQNGGT